MHLKYGLEQENLSDTEVFTLNIATLEYQRVFHNMEESSLLEYIENRFSLTFEKGKEKEHTLYALQQLWSEGSVASLFAHVQFSPYIKVKDMIAFDASQFSMLVSISLHLEFLNEEEAWGFLFLNAKRIQDSFSNWDEFKVSYCKGLALYDFTQLEKKEQEKFLMKDEFIRRNDAFTLDCKWLEKDIFKDIKIEKINIIKEN